MNQSPWANYHSLNMKHNIKLTPYSDESRTSTLKHADHHGQTTGKQCRKIRRNIGSTKAEKLGLDPGPPRAPTWELLLGSGLPAQPQRGQPLINQTDNRPQTPTPRQQTPHPRGGGARRPPLRNPATPEGGGIRPPPHPTNPIRVVLGRALPLGGGVASPGAL